MLQHITLFIFCAVACWAQSMEQQESSKIDTVPITREVAVELTMRCLHSLLEEPASEAFISHKTFLNQPSQSLRFSSPIRSFCLRGSECWAADKTNIYYCPSGSCADDIVLGEGLHKPRLGTNGHIVMALDKKGIVLCIPPFSQAKPSEHSLGISVADFGCNLYHDDQALLAIQAVQQPHKLALSAYDIQKEIPLHFVTMPPDISHLSCLIHIPQNRWACFGSKYLILYDERSKEAPQQVALECNPAHMIVNAYQPKHLIVCSAENPEIDCLDVRKLTEPFKKIHGTTKTYGYSSLTNYATDQIIASCAGVPSVSTWDSQTYGHIGNYPTQNPLKQINSTSDNCFVVQAENTPYILERYKLTPPSLEDVLEVCP